MPTYPAGYLYVPCVDGVVVYGWVMCVHAVTIHHLLWDGNGYFRYRLYVGKFLGAVGIYIVRRSIRPPPPVILELLRVLPY